MAQNNRNVNYQIKLSAKVDASVKRLQKQLKDIDDKVNKVNKGGINPKVNPKTKKSVDGLGKSFGGLTDKLKGAIKNIPLVGSELAALAGPIGIAVAAIAAIGTVLVSTALDIDKVDRAVRQFTNNKGEIKEVTNSFRALQKTFGDKFELEGSLKLANEAAKGFNISLKEAKDLIEKAEISTGGMFDPAVFDDMIGKLADVGIGAEEAFAAVTAAQREGFSPTKILDTLGEFGLSIREMTKAQEDALTGAGFDPSKISKDIESGAKTQKQVFNEIFSKEGLTKKQKQTLVADLLKGPGEDIGGRGIAFLVNQNKSLDELVKKNADLAKINERNKKLTEAQDNATRQLIPAIKKVEEIWTRIQTAFFEILTPIIDLGVEIGKLIGDLGVFEAIGANISISWELIKGTVTVISKSIQIIIRLIRGLVQIVKVGLLAAFNKLKEVIIDIFGEERISRWKDNIITAFNFIRKIWENIANFISNTFEKLGNFAAGKGFELNVKTDANASGEANKGPTNQSGGGAAGAAPTVDGKIAGALDTNVRSSIQGEVKNITISIDKIQEIGVQNIGANDMESFKENLQIAFSTILADTSQL